MLDFHHPCELAGALQVSCRHLLEVLERADDYYEELVLLDPNRPGKHRRVVNPRGKLRAFQARFYQRVLTSTLPRSRYSHGGVPGRSILTNVRPHLGQSFVFTTDVSDFFPSIHQQRIFDLFGRLGCSPEVASLCTRLSTYRHCLAQGLVTSPILADFLMRAVDKRIEGIRYKHDLVYTRFMDDLAISGPFDLARSGIPKLVRRILQENGFEVNQDKDQFGRLAKGATVTGIRFPHGHPDVRRTYVEEVVRQVRDATSLGRAQPFQGPYYTQAQITGRVRFICWVNPGRRMAVLPLLRRIDWVRVRAEAQKRGLEMVTKTLVRMGTDSVPKTEK